MASNNTVLIVGNLTDDPNMRITPQGQTVTRFSVAVNRRWQDRTTGEWKEETSYIPCTVWRDQGENVAQSFKKGMRVIVSGRLQQRSWETPEGDQRSIVEILVDECGPSLRWATAEVSKTSRYGEGAAPEPEADMAGMPPDISQPDNFEPPQE